jgi:hypothetical protein
MFPLKRSQVQIHSDQISAHFKIKLLLLNMNMGKYIWKIKLLLLDMNMSKYICSNSHYQISVHFKIKLLLLLNMNMSKYIWKIKLLLLNMNMSKYI